jgi:capsular polysaccharide biosynthesis protein
MKDFFNKIKRKWQTILIIIFVVVAITFSASIFIPAKYSSEIKMMIIQNHQSDKVDAFSAAKSAEYLSNIIANIIFTEAFIGDVFDAPFEIEKQFPNSAEEKMKVWERTLDIRKENNTGILNIRVLDKSQKEAEAIADSIAWALNTRGDKYHGGGDSVQIKMIDGPITSENPAYPNVLLNTLLALVVGAAGAFSVIYFFDDFELILFSNKKTKRARIKKETTDEMVAKLEKIRENLKNQNTVSLVSEDYKIEDKREEAEISEKTENLDEVEEALKKEEMIVNKEAVVSEEEAKDNQQGKIVFKKSEAPRNLPIFSDEKDGNVNNKNDKSFISMEELNREAEKMGLATPNHSVQGAVGDKTTKYEASSDEVKERLNKLLRGEL